MVNYLDGLIGRVVAALQAKGMWGNTLWVSSADNGGPIYQSGAAGANNFPLRGSMVRGCAPYQKGPSCMARSESPLSHAVHPMERFLPIDSRAPLPPSARRAQMSNWEGGVRVNAYASGGAIPPAVRNTTVTGLISLADWYTTFSTLGAGVMMGGARATGRNTCMHAPALPVQRASIRRTSGLRPQAFPPSTASTS